MKKVEVEKNPELPDLETKEGIEQMRERIKQLEKTNLNPIKPKEEVQVKERIQVVKEIPMKRSELEDGSIIFTPTKSVKEGNSLIHFMTIEEALTLLLNEE